MTIYMAVYIYIRTRISISREDQYSSILSLPYTEKMTTNIIKLFLPDAKDA